MFIKNVDARKKENAPSCTVWEYDFPSKELWFAIVDINGRFPESGKAVNHQCDEIYYIIEGEWTIHQETGDYIIKQWDAFFFEKGKRYRVEGNNLKINVSTTPARFLQQYENIPW